MDDTPLTETMAYRLGRATGILRMLATWPDGTDLVAMAQDFIRDEDALIRRQVAALMSRGD